MLKVHDIIDPARGKANLRGVYDVPASTGWMPVCTDHETASIIAVTPFGR